MKALNQYIQEKYLIDKDTKIEYCQNFNDLLSVHTSLKNMQVSNNDQKAGFKKVLNCSKDDFETYTKFFKNFTEKHTTNDLEKFVSSSSSKITISNMEDWDGSKWNEIIVINTKTHSDMFDIIFNEEKPIIKIYVPYYMDKYINDAAKIIDYVLYEN